MRALRHITRGAKKTSVAEHRLGSSRSELPRIAPRLPKRPARWWPASALRPSAHQGRAPTCNPASHRPGYRKLIFVFCLELGPCVTLTTSKPRPSSNVPRAVICKDHDHEQALFCRLCLVRSGGASKERRETLQLTRGQHSVYQRALPARANGRTTPARHLGHGVARAVAPVRPPAQISNPSVVCGVHARAWGSQPE